MNSGAEAADQVVGMSLRGIEVLAEISGEGAKNLATYLYAVLKDQKKTKGKIRLEGLLRSGKELKIFAVCNEDLKKFTMEAKRYGVLYCALRDKKSLDGMCDIMVRIEDAAKINRIVERFKLATVDMAGIKSEIQKSKAGKQEEKATLTQINNPNPMTAVTEKSHPSEPICEHSGRAAGGTTEPEQKSIRQELKEIKEMQREQAETKRETTKEQSKSTNPTAQPNKAKVKSESKKPKEK